MADIQCVCQSKSAANDYEKVQHPIACQHRSMAAETSQSRISCCSRKNQTLHFRESKAASIKSQTQHGDISIKGKSPLSSPRGGRKNGEAFNGAFFGFARECPAPTIRADRPVLVRSDREFLFLAARSGKSRLLHSSGAIGLWLKSWRSCLLSGLLAVYGLR